MDLAQRIAALESELATLKSDLAESASAAAPVTATSAAVTTSSRRHLLRAAAVGAAGAAGATLVAARPAAAANGGAVLLGALNKESLVTRIHNQAAFPNLNGPGPIVLQLESPGGHLRFVGAPGDTAFGTYPDGTLVYNGSTGLELWVVGPNGPHPVLLARPGTADAFELLPAPVRVYDSRPGALPDLPGDTRLAAGTVRTVDLQASGSELFLEGITGVMLNLTITDTIGSGFLAVFSAAQSTPPGTSNVNWSGSGQTVANLAVTASQFGSVKLQAGGTGSTHVIIDVVGIYG